MNRRQAIAIVGLPLLLAACFSNRASFRYKLALTLDTPEGVRSGFSVVEVDARDVSIPGRGTMSRVKGEAVYVDLESDARPLVALIADISPRPTGFKWWSEGIPNTENLLRLYSAPAKSDETLIDRVGRLARMRGLIKLTASDLPDLVTFADINDPKSVLKVDPHNLPATLGRDIEWSHITIEVTNEPVTTGIENKLPWLKSLQGGLDGSRLRRVDGSLGLANALNATAFKRGT